MDSLTPSVHTLKLLNKPVVTSSSNGCQVACVNDSTAYVSLGHQLHKIQVKLNPNPHTDLDVLKPIPTTLLENSLIEHHHNHSSNIQTVKCHSQNDILSLFTIDEEGSAVATRQNSLETVQDFRTPACALNGLRGWAGITFSQADPTNFFTASFWSNSINYFNQDKLVRKINLAGRPTQIDFIEEKNILAVAENSFITLWDSRQAERGGNVSRLYPPVSETLHAISTRPDLICVGGLGRSVSFFETRTWNCRTTWKNCTKNQITALHFTPGQEQCYVADDSMVQCYKLSHTTSKSDEARDKLDYFGGIKFDSRLLGISCQKSQNTLFAFSSNGTIYNIQNLNQISLKETKSSESATAPSGPSASPGVKEPPKKKHKKNETS